MQWLLDHAEGIYRLGVLAGGIIGLYLACKRVAAANKQAEAQIRQADASTRQAELGQTKLVTDLIAQAVGQLAVRGWKYGSWQCTLCVGLLLTFRITVRLFLNS